MGLRVFISYRRADCSMHAGRLAENLRARPGYEVFFDIDTIMLGENFVERIGREIDQCDVLLVMIGDEWLDMVDRDGQRRIDDPLDFVHLEIKSALERSIPVVPLLVEGARMPRPEELPEPLKGLALRHGTELRDASWPQDVDRLATALGRIGPVPPVHAPAPEKTPEARRGKQSKPIDFEAAARFTAAIPKGRWTTYKDVAVASGSPQGAQAVGGWLMTNGDRVDHVWRVLDRHGRVSNGFKGTTAALPQTAEDARHRLEDEGVRFDERGCADPAQRWPAPGGQAKRAAPTGEVVVVAARSAWPDYLLSSSYICQAERSFQPVTHVAFYFDREIQPKVPRILHRRDGVRFTRENAEALRESGGPFDAEVADLIEFSSEQTDGFRIRRDPSTPYQVFLLSGPEDADTITLPQPVWHGGTSAFTMGQRYVALDALRRGPATTDEL